jgi:hypothetical protein
MKEMVGILIATLSGAWPATAVLATSSSLGFLGSAGFRFPPLRSFLVLFLPVVLLSAWGGGNWAAQGGPHPTEWRGRVLDAIAILSVLTIIWTLWHFRRSPRWWVLLPAAMSSLVLAAAAWFIGGMAIWNSWL